MNPYQSATNDMYSGLFKTQDETLRDYFERLRTTREGGILGTSGLGQYQRPSIEEEAAEKGLAQVVVNPVAETSGDGTDMPSLQERYEGSNYYSTGRSLEQYKRGKALDRLTGREYAAQGLFYGIPHLIGSYLDEREVREDLKAQGYSDDQIDRLLKDPEWAKALNAQGRLVPGEDEPDLYDYKEQGTQDSIFDVGKSVVGSLFGLDKEQSRQSPFRPSDDYEMISPLLSSARTKDVLMAQEYNPYDPVGELFSLDGLVRQAEERARAQQEGAVAMSAKNVAEATKLAEQYGVDATKFGTSEEIRAAAMAEKSRQEAARRAAAMAEKSRQEAARKAAEEAARRASEAARTREVEAQLARERSYNSGGGSGISGYNWGSASSSSRGSSALGGTSSGDRTTSVSSVGSRGGNASRGFSSGGW